MQPAEIVEKFYTAFANKDYTTMQDCYSDHATFSDPAFGKLNAAEVRGMWEMLLKGAPELNVTFHNLKTSGNIVTVNWIAKYKFSATGKNVVNNIHATIICVDGKIVQHEDVFNFYTWAKQALGIKGLLLGWTHFLRSKVRTTAKAKLAQFMRRSES